MLLLKRDSYDGEGIESAVAAIFEYFGGIENFVSPGSRVLLKVNLVAGHRPDRRVTTDPSVVRAAARLVLDAGGHPVIADSPGIDGFARAAQKAGFMDVAGELGIPCVELTDPVPLPVAPDASFHKIEVARRVLESDLIINLPKMKTHAQMLLTLGVKNMFGCVVAQRKAEWHYNVGLRREVFASLLLDIWNGIRSACGAGILTIMDGVIGMDGFGPTGGNPFPYGVVAGATDALTMDFRLCRMMGVRLEDYPLWQAAALRHMPQCDPDEGDLAGDFSAEHVWKGLDIPRLDSLSVLPVLSRLPFGKILEQALTSRPVHLPDRCVGCGKCAGMCRAGAIALRGTTLSFDYGKCIRCYCCHEMCPANAIEFRDGLLRKAMKFLRK
ncbi:MAG: DUF362 domain-containing protein [Synergistaceae bacterium]|jgi:uncharacterized protein (DUF362 family)/NAD-dependent dihydropyrimidine dehydrogenase PreA subunit|nr:DUF362 domain-containing protein [Synergistaceae bacterium]